MRGLVEGGGHHSPVREVIETMIRSWGISSLQADTVHFLIIDFTSGVDLITVLGSALTEISTMQKKFYWNSFSERYHGKIIVIIGAETVERNIPLNGIKSMAKYAPTLFIRKFGTDLEKCNRDFFEAIGAYVDMDFKMLC
jgi:hypothetical protein